MTQKDDDPLGKASHSPPLAPRKTVRILRRAGRMLFQCVCVLGRARLGLCAAKSLNELDFRYGQHGYNAVRGT